MLAIDACGDVFLCSAGFGLAPSVPRLAVGVGFWVRASLDDRLGHSKPIMFQFIS